MLNIKVNVCEYEVNWSTNEKVIRGKQTLMQIFKDAARLLTHIPARVSPIYKSKFSSKNPANERHDLWTIVINKWAIRIYSHIYIL